MTFSAELIVEVEVVDDALIDEAEFKNRIFMSNQKLSIFTLEHN